VTHPVDTDSVDALRGWRTIALAVIVVGLVACDGSEETQDAEPAPEPASGGIPWPAPSDPLDLAVAAGLEPTTREFLDFHVHAHLDVFVNGSAVEVPGGIGINIEDPAVQTTQTDLGPAYGGIDPPCAQPCISPLHTHGPDGVLHTESAVDQPNTLGQFFTEWGVALTDTCVGGYCSPGTPVQVFVNGELYEGDPAEIQLMDQLEIAIVIGSPPDEVPSSFPEA
jgi:hypothetical protein